MLSAMEILLFKFFIFLKINTQKRRKVQILKRGICISSGGTYHSFSREKQKMAIKHESRGRPLYSDLHSKKIHESTI